GRRLAPNMDLHHFIKRDAIFPPIVELGGARGGMGRHLARLLQRAAVLEVGGDPGAAEGVVADLRCDASLPGATAHHSPSIVSVEPLTIELRLAAAVWPILDGLEQRHPPSLGQPGTLDVSLNNMCETKCRGCVRTQSQFPQ